MAELALVQAEIIQSHNSTEMAQLFKLAFVKYNLKLQVKFYERKIAAEALLDHRSFKLFLCRQI